MRYYAIRRKSDGAFFPQHNRKRGFTRTEPSKSGPPRLFVREMDAKNALRWWAKGITTVRMVGGSGSWVGEDDYSEDWSTDPVPGRRAEDMEVIPIAVIPMKLRWGGDPS